MHPRDDVLTFNYDCLIDHALRTYGAFKWNARYGYGFQLGARGSRLTGDQHWRPSSSCPKEETIHVHKLHGSMHFYIKEGGKDRSKYYQVTFKERPYTRQAGNLKFSIIPPEWHKAYDKGAFGTLWENAASAIHRTAHVIVIGYSLPPTDLHATSLFRTSVRRDHLRSLVIVNPDQEARRRCRTVFQRGLTPDTRIISFDRLEHFVAADRSIWAV